MDETSILLDTRDVRAIALGNAIVTAWHRAPRVDVIAALASAVAPYHADHPEGAVLLIVPTHDAPDEAARRELQAFLQRLGKSLIAAAVVLPLSGLKGAIVRTAAMGVVAAMRLPFPVKIVDSPVDAATFTVGTLRKKLSQVVEPSTVARLLREATLPFVNPIGP